MVLEADFTPQDARWVLLRAMDEGLAFDAIFTNDEMATGVLRALYERGKRVPADIAVVGCDGLPLGPQTIPQLTTVALDYEQMGKVAVERLFSRQEENAPVFRIRLVPQLVMRESSGGNSL